jgi:hypothetical protein
LPKKLASFRVATEFNPPTSSLFLLLWLLLLLSIGFFQLLFFFLILFRSKGSRGGCSFLLCFILKSIFTQAGGHCNISCTRLTICNIFFFFFSCREKCPDQEKFIHKEKKGQIIVTVDDDDEMSVQFYVLLGASLFGWPTSGDGPSWVSCRSFLSTGDSLRCTLVQSPICLFIEDTTKDCRAF